MCTRAFLLSLALGLCNAQAPQATEPALSATEMKLQKYYNDLDAELLQTFDEDEPMPGEDSTEVLKQQAALGIAAKGSVSAEEAENLREATMRERISQKLAKGEGLTRSQRAQMRKDGLTMAALHNATASLDAAQKEALNVDAYGQARFSSLQGRKALAKELLERKATGDFTLTEAEKAKIDAAREERTRILYDRIESKRHNGARGGRGQRLTRSEHTALKQIEEIKAIQIADSKSKSPTQQIRILKNADGKKMLQHYEDSKGWVSDHSAYMFTEKDNVPFVEEKKPQSLLAKSAKKDIALALDSFEVEPHKDFE